MAALPSLLRRASFSWRCIATRSFASVGTQIDFQSNIALQKARSWDEGVSTKFSTSPLREIFKDKKVVIFGLPGAYTGVCTLQHVPSFSKNADKFKDKGVDSIICVSVNDPYVMNAWAEKLQCKDKINFFGDFDGKFHKYLKLEADLSSALLGLRSQRWSAFVDSGTIKIWNVEKAPSDFKVSDADTLLKQIENGV